jgi:FkbM family methyltransferase
MLEKLEKLVGKWKPFFFLFYPVILLRRRYFQRDARYYDSLLKMVVEGSLIVKIPDFQGTFEIDIRSHILKTMLMDKQFEPELITIIKKYIDAGKDVLDIGANVGLYSVLFSTLIGKSNRVLAVEPTPLALKYLHGNLQRNGSAESVVVFEGIATDAKGDFHLNVIPGMEEYSSIGKIVHSSVEHKPAETINAKGDTVDNLINAFGLRPGFIKIDVEGAEYQVLCGALKTMREFHPVILAELSEKLLSSCGATPEMVTGLLQQNGYRITSIGGNILALPKA